MLIRNLSNSSLLKFIYSYIKMAILNMTIAYILTSVKLFWIEILAKMHHIYNFDI